MPTGVYKRSDEFRKKLSDHNKRIGRKPPSSLGRKMSDETKRKIGEKNAVNMKGKKASNETRAKLSSSRLGEKNSFYGKKHSSITKEKMSASKIENPTKHWLGKIRDLKYWLGKKRPDITGDKHPNWNDGSSFEPYSKDWTKTLKLSIRERDGMTCRLCGSVQSKTPHEVHHIDYNKKNCDPQNLITLCKSCHSKTSSGDRKKWMQVLLGKN